MKKQLVLGMVAVSVVMGSFSSAYAATRRADVQKAIEAGVKRGIENPQAVGIRAIERVDRATEISSDFAADRTALQTAMGRTIDITTPDGARRVDLLEVGIAIKSAKETLSDARVIDKTRLDKDGREYTELLETAVDTSAAFLALASNTLTVRDRTFLSEAQQLSVDSFNRQLSLIPEMLSGKMDQAELKSHVEMMDLAVKSKPTATARIAGEDAFSTAMNTKYGTKAKDKMTELKNCK